MATALRIVLPAHLKSEPPSTSRDFAGLYRATVAPLRRYLSRLLQSESEAQDVAHDAYMRIYARGALERADCAEAVLYTTARRLAFNQLKRRRVGPFEPLAAPQDATVSPSPGVVQQVMARQELAQVEEAIAALPPGCRTVLLLRKVELLSHQEIGERLGISVSTVEKQHARALRLLRARLSAPAHAEATVVSAEEARA